MLYSSDSEPLRGAPRNRTAEADLLWLESPSNPLLAVADPRAVCAARRKPDALIVVDSTLATPLVQPPLELGADLVMHSPRRTWAAIPTCCSEPVVAASTSAHRCASGASSPEPRLGALEAYLAVRGMRTLALRLQRASTTAADLAERLAQHPGVAVVRHPGRPDHPTHATARRFMAGFGAVVSFDIEGGAEPADGVCRAVRSSPCHEPGRRRVDLERRAVIPPGLLRLSVGCEHPDDLWRDLQQALKP